MRLVWEFITIIIHRIIKISFFSSSGFWNLCWFCFGLSLWLRLGGSLLGSRGLLDLFDLFFHGLSRCSCSLLDYLLDFLCLLRLLSSGLLRLWFRFSALLGLFGLFLHGNLFLLSLSLFFLLLLLSLFFSLFSSFLFSFKLSPLFFSLSFLFSLFLLLFSFLLKLLLVGFPLLPLLFLSFSSQLFSLQDSLCPLLSSQLISLNSF